MNTNIEKYTNRTGTSSFFRNHHKEINDEDIITHKVKCISLSNLVKEQSIEHIDLLQIDTEGYDYEILKSINFNEIKPSIVSFEHGVRMGIMSKEQLFEIQNILMDNGYSVLIDEHDVRAHLIS